MSCPLWVTKQAEGSGSGGLGFGRHFPSLGFYFLIYKMKGLDHTISKERPSSKTHDFTIGVSCLALCYLNLMNSETSSPLPALRWTPEEKGIEAVFSLSTVHPLRLLSALAPERKEKQEMRLPWQSNGLDSPRPLQRAQVQSLFRELWFPRPICQAAKKKEKRKKKLGKEAEKLNFKK